MRLGINTGQKNDLLDLIQSRRLEGPPNKSFSCATSTDRVSPRLSPWQQVHVIRQQRRRFGRHRHMRRHSYTRTPVPAQFASRPTLYSLLPPTSCAVFTSFMMSLCAAHFFRSQTERSLRVAVVAHSCSGTVFISQNTFRYTCGKVTFFHLYF